MAKQKGIIKLKGTMGDVTFYRTKDGYLAREKGGVDRQRIMNDPAFKRTRENGMEFGTAGRGGQLIRKGIRRLLRLAGDSRVTSRLLKILMEIIKTDSVSERGKRKIQEGNMGLLEGFDFNDKGKLNSVFFSGYHSNFDRATGEFDLDIDAFVPTEAIEAPKGTTHIQIMTGVCALDFDGRSFEENHVFSPVISWDEQSNAALSLTANLTAGLTHPVIQLVGVSFFQEVNGEMYALRNGVYNALAIVGVDQI